jgi:hypothetical protein
MLKNRHQSQTPSLIEFEFEENDEEREDNTNKQTNPAKNL